MPDSEDESMHVRKISGFTLAIVAAGLALTACDNGGGDKTPSSTTGSSVSTGTPQSRTSVPDATPGSARADTPSGSSHSTPPGTPNKAGVKCTNQINYAGDPRPNAEINSIGEKTGYCPAPKNEGTPSGTPNKAGVKCTDQINYAGDTRPNAEINSIGEKTGYCPPVKR
ncbi:hypothetical protein ACFXHK_01870 [Embleya sp. NPDC059267]|uniref:hypothetical protein n=1 Tax=Embleya sp. NPDC059267 TaxID=3346798 RepID=UPI003678E1FF